MTDTDKTWCCYLRCYVEAASAEAAQPIAAQICAILERFVTPTLKPIERYWKIAEYQEVLFEWQLDDAPESAHLAIRDALGPQWHEQHEADAIWDYRMYAPLVISGVRWAQLEYFLCSAMVTNNDISN
ncbi:hypothetical protein [Armatimonas sp.]|uniref:hypothetical protein n=1 Tax=Armatimonas sp. TaxID=1872638 RepID=UPI00286BD0A7|nr:hypothetical protein [Armatimonas sp.]